VGVFESSFILLSHFFSSENVPGLPKSLRVISNVKYPFVGEEGKKKSTLLIFFFLILARFKAATTYQNRVQS